MSTMKISVVIPAYNSAEFLPMAIESALKQSYPPHEVIVVDDGSTDDTREVVARYPVRYIAQENRGLSGARNTGIRHAAGEWIALLDADDWWHPDKLEAQAQIADHADLVYTALTCAYPDGTMSPARHVAAQDLWPSLIYFNSVGPSSVIIRKSALIDFGMFDVNLRACEELDLWFRMVRKARFASVPEPLTYYRIHAGTITSDPARMLSGFKTVFDRHLPRRWVFRRARAYSRQYHHAAVSFREQGSYGRSTAHSLRSLLRWPSPLWMPERFLVPVITLKHAIAMQIRRRGESRRDTPHARPRILIDK